MKPKEFLLHLSSLFFSSPSFKYKKGPIRYKRGYVMFIPATTDSGGLTLYASESYARVSGVVDGKAFHVSVIDELNEETATRLAETVGRLIE